MVSLLEMLEKGKLVDEPSCKQMIEILKTCEDKQKFPRYLKGVTLAHKTGEVDVCRTDAGLLYFPGGPVALCVLTDGDRSQRGGNANTGSTICAEAAKAVVDYCNAKFKPAAAAKDAGATK